MKILSILFVVCMFLVIPMALATDCYVANNCGGDNAIIALSDATGSNNHAGIVGTSTYTNFLCCAELDASGGPDVILRLSDTNDSHVDFVDTNGYSEVVSTTLQGTWNLVFQSASCAMDECVMALSDDENAHVASCGNPFTNPEAGFLCLEGVGSSGVSMDCGGVVINGVALADTCVERGSSNPVCLNTQCNYEDAVGVATCIDDGDTFTNELGRTIECHTEVAGFNTWCPVGYNWDGAVCSTNTLVCDEGYNPDLGMTFSPLLSCYVDEDGSLLTTNADECVADYVPPAELPPYDEACCYDFNWTGASNEDYNFYSNTLPISDITVY